MRKAMEFPDLQDEMKMQFLVFLIYICHMRRHLGPVSPTLLATVLNVQRCLDVFQGFLLIQLTESLFKYSVQGDE